MKKMVLKMFVPFLCLAALFLTACGPVQYDSQLNCEQAIYMNQPPDVSPLIQAQLEVVAVTYYGYDGLLHEGQLVVNRVLAEDVRAVFQVIRAERFPLESVIPIAHPEIQKKGPYGLSPDTNNSSGYVWRPIVHASRLSLHALGLAVDLNPRQNPYIKGDLVLPPAATYDPAVPGTLSVGSPVVQAFKKLGWQWGGEWSSGPVDYMHFQKVPAEVRVWAEAHELKIR